MNLEPLLAAPFAIKLHVASVMPAALIGAYVLLARKGTPLHRALGRIWVALMVVTALSSFFIHSIDLLWGFSPIHLLSVLVLAGCARAVQAARRGDIAQHRRIMAGVYFGGIVGAGAFTLLPGRIMHAVVLTGPVPSAPMLACALAVIVVGLRLLQAGIRL